MNYTPGPWFAFEANYQADHEDSLLPIFVVGPQEFHTVAQVRAGSADDDLPAQTKANARLIAASPDLLDALKRARAFAIAAINANITGIDFDPTEHALIQQIDAAITKAEGRS